MPDIDIDFTDVRRDEVVAYVRNKYGADRVAQIITFGTMAARAAIRDAGRALGIPYGFCDQIAKMIPITPNPDKKSLLEKSLEDVAELRDLYKRDANAKKLLDAAKNLRASLGTLPFTPAAWLFQRSPDQLPAASIRAPR